jgi:serine/threonine protein kinase
MGEEAAPQPRRSKDTYVGRVLRKRYALDVRVGEGGMGLVYRAFDLQKDRAVVAVKLLPLRTDEEGQEHAARFEKEADLMRRLRHPNIVRYLDHGRESGLLYLVMELLDGKTLSDAVPQAGVDWSTAVDVVEEICDALRSAHAQQVIHRDMKPDNVFLARQPDGSAIVKVIDFGLAKDVGEDGPALTMMGKVVGSAGYIAPEHILGGRSFTEQSDVYAVGAILFFMLTGRRPYQGMGVPQIMQAQVNEKPPHLDLPDDHPNMLLEPVVRRAMSRSIDKRYPSVDALMSAVHAAVAPLKRPRAATLVLSGLTVVRQAVRDQVRRGEPALALAAGMVTGLAILGGIWWLWFR